MADLSCHCYGIDRRTRCEHDATEEDGLCDVCRCVHGCCADHWPEDITWTKELFFDDPATFMMGMEVAFGRATDCLIAKRARGHESVEEDA
jgi:hypothetical protein